MIKRLFLTLLVAMTVAGVSAQKTKYIAWGVEAGMNFNKMSFSRSDFESGNRAGFFVGPKIKVNIPLLGFGADAAVLYSLNSSKVTKDTPSGESETVCRNLSYFEIPLNLRYNFNLRILNLYLATGPQYNYCLSGSSTIEELYGAYDGTEGGSKLSDFSRSTWGWNVGAGVEIASRFQIALTYTIPISDSGSLEKGNLTNIVTNFKQKTVKVRLAYYF